MYNYYYSRVLLNIIYFCSIINLLVKENNFFIIYIYMKCLSPSPSLSLFLSFNNQFIIRQVMFNFYELMKYFADCILLRCTSCNQYCAQTLFSYFFPSFFLTISAFLSVETLIDTFLNYSSPCQPVSIPCCVFSRFYWY